LCLVQGSISSSLSSADKCSRSDEIHSPSVSGDQLLKKSKQAVHIHQQWVASSLVCNWANPKSHVAPFLFSTHPSQCSTFTAHTTDHHTHSFVFSCHACISYDTYVCHEHHPLSRSSDIRNGPVSLYHISGHPDQRFTHTGMSGILILFAVCVLCIGKDLSDHSMGSSMDRAHLGLRLIETI